jgi:hypothetical protein
MRQQSHGVFFLSAMCDSERNFCWAIGRMTSLPDLGRSTTHRRDFAMNHLTWIGIIVWGLFVTGFGLIGAGPATAGEVAAPHDLMLLLVAGIVSCLIGALGLVGCMGWVPGLRMEQKSCS